MKDRKAEILELATELIQTKGYSAFSYQDLSDRLGIRKASIHHHYPTKEDLGKAVLAHYMERAKKNLQVVAQTSDDPWQRLDGFFELVRGTQQEGDRICCIGSVYAALTVVPQEIGETASHLAQFIVSWLSEVLGDGKKEGSMAFNGKPEAQALAVFCAMQGALQMDRAESGGILDSVMGQVRENLSV
jgi:TetR/AcrR family transcriptional repressor of nem operon